MIVFDERTGLPIKNLITPDELAKLKKYVSDFYKTTREEEENDGNPNEG